MRPYGVVDFEVALPEGRMKMPKDLAQKIRVYEKPVAYSLIELFDIASQTIRKLLFRADICQTKVKTLLVGGTGVFEKSKWSAASALQHLSGLSSARIMDFQNGCLSMLTGSKIGEGLLFNKTDEYVVLVCLDQYTSVIDPSNPDQWCIASYGDSVGVYLLGKGSVRYQLLDFDWNSRGEFSESDYLDPKTQKMVMSVDEDSDHRLSQAYKQHYKEWIYTLLDRNQLCSKDVYSIFMNQGDHHLIRYLTEALNLPPKLIFKTHEMFGHLGANDIFFGLQQSEVVKTIPGGSYFITSASSYGFSWGSALWRKV